jgi:hypothetical protein
VFVDVLFCLLLRISGLKGKLLNVYIKLDGELVYGSSQISTGICDQNLASV